MAEIHIDELLKRINDEGIEKARESEEKIVNDAKAKADKIIKSAESNAEEIINNAKKEAELFKKQSTESIKQAAQNTALELKNELNAMIKAVIHKGLNKQLDSNLVSSLVKEVIKDKKNDSYALEVSSKILFEVSSVLHNEIKEGLVIAANDNIKGGFKLVDKDGSGYYDFTSNELIALMSAYLSQAVNKALGVK